MRQARVNACRQWLLQCDDLDERTTRYVGSLWFFDRFFLWPEEEVDFNPLFYDDVPFVSPDYHWQVARQWISWRKNITIAPRGGAKSKFNQKDILLRMLSRMAYSFMYATSSHPNARETGETIKYQLLFNPRISDDWSPEMPDGRIAPRRGEGSFSTEHMRLTNGSWVRLISAQSKQRGGRPRRYRLDDPEYDPKAATSMSVLRQYMEELLFKVVIPMVTRPDTGVDWIGTYVSKRHYLWHAMQVEETPQGERAKDPRFNRWSRLHVPAVIDTPDGQVSCWRTMWPATRADRLQLAIKDKRYLEGTSLEEIREDVGSAIFNSEFLGRPGDVEDSFFQVDLDSKGRHAWWFEDCDGLEETTPRISKTLICWHETKKGVTSLRKVPLEEFLQHHVRTFITLDTSYTSGPDSDYKVAAVQAITNNNDLFVLDLWAKQCVEDRLVRAAFKMCDKWGVPSLHPEVVKESVSLFNTLYHIVSTRAEDMAGTSMLPAVRPIKVGMIEKTAKIAGGLYFRFDHSKIKLPVWRRGDRIWRMLFNQIEEFNPEADDGGLQHDDCLDVVAMSQFVLKGRLSKAPPQQEEEKSLKDRLVDGDFRRPDGSHAGHGLDLALLTYQDVQDILDAREQRSGERRPPSKI